MMKNKNKYHTVEWSPKFIRKIVKRNIIKNEWPFTFLAWYSLFNKTSFIVPNPPVVSFISVPMNAVNKICIVKWKDIICIAEREI